MSTHKLKRTGLLLLVFALFVSTTNNVNAQQGSGSKTVLSLGGSAGLINVASTDITKGLAVGTWFTTDFDKGSNFAVRAAFGFGDNFEIFGGADVPTEQTSSTDGLFGAKWTFFDGGDVSIGVLGNIQFNSILGNKMSVDGQILIAATWKMGQFKTSAVFGKSLGEYTTWKSWDFGMGAEWWFLEKPVFSMAWVFDFANYNYRVSGMDHIAGFNQNRGIFSTTLRFSFFNNLLGVDVGGADLLDSNRAFVSNVFVNLAF